MKQRHQLPARKSRTLVRDESGTLEASVSTSQRGIDAQTVRSLTKVELRRLPQGDFLVFRTNEGSQFSWNLDCQEEYGFEAKETMRKWAAEQGS